MMSADDWKELGVMHANMVQQFNDKIDDVAVHIHERIDAVNASISDQKGIIMLAKEASNRVYEGLDKHKRDLCPKIEAGINEHYKTEHKPLAGKILKTVLLCLGGILTLMTIVSGLYWVATHISL